MEGCLAVAWTTGNVVSVSVFVRTEGFKRPNLLHDPVELREAAQPESDVRICSLHAGLIPVENVSQRTQLTARKCLSFLRHPAFNNPLIQPFVDKLLVDVEGCNVPRCPIEIVIRPLFLELAEPRRAVPTSQLLAYRRI